MPNHQPTCCSHCGVRAVPDAPRRDRVVLITVVSELGSSAVCGLCVITLLPRLGSDLTLFVARPAAVAS